MPEVKEESVKKQILLSLPAFFQSVSDQAFREVRVSVCGKLCPNEGGGAGYGNRMLAIDKQVDPDSACEKVMKNP